MVVTMVMVSMPMMMVLMVSMASACPRRVCDHRREQDERGEQLYFFHLGLR